MKSSTKAFTLIELLVVIAIIAILSAIVLANLAGARSKSRDAKRVSDINQLQLVAQLYFDKCNRYPAASGNIPDIASATGCPTGITLATFISQIPTPPTGVAGVTTYYYIVKSDGSDFYLATPLENTNQILLDDIDGTVGAASGWAGYNNGTFSAADPMYAVTSK